MDLISDEENAEFQFALVQRPDMGDVIPGSGGIRKVRWKLEGRGKSGGIRIIYYWYVGGEELRMLYAYAKGKQENLTQEKLATLKKLLRGGTMDKDMFNELLASVEEMDQIAKGKKRPARQFHFKPLDVVAIRKKTGLSQSQFALLMGVSVRTLQNWEQGHRKPRGSAASLLRIVDKDPDAALQALHS